MKKNIALMIGVATLLGGCPSEPPPPPQAAQPTPPPVQPPPEVASKAPPSTTALVVPGLIPAANGDKQKSQVVVGRADPFALIPIKPKVTIDPSRTDKINNQGEPGSKSASPEAIAPNFPAPNLPFPVPFTPPSPPAPPQPTEANQVLVSGIIQLPTSAIAIVRAPGERTVRSVAPGATLSNGQVLVKAIYANPDNPIVILEQYGIQVTKKLGAAAQPPQTPGATS